MFVVLEEGHDRDTGTERSRPRRKACVGEPFGERNKCVSSYAALAGRLIDSVVQGCGGRTSHYSPTQDVGDLNRGCIDSDAHHDESPDLTGQYGCPNQNRATEPDSRVSRLCHDTASERTQPRHSGNKPNLSLSQR